MRYLPSTLPPRQHLVVRAVVGGCALVGALVGPWWLMLLPAAGAVLWWGAPEGVVAALVFDAVHASPYLLWGVSCGEWLFTAALLTLVALRFLVRRVYGGDGRMREK